MYKSPDLGWQLLENSLDRASPRLWGYAEKVFYHQYREQFHLVEPYLNRILQEGIEEAGDTWGRISALASLEKHISQEKLFQILETASSSAWEGVTQVFVANLASSEYRTECTAGILNILSKENLSKEVIREIDNCFDESNRSHIQYDPSFIETFIQSLSNFRSGRDIDDFLEWLSCEARLNPQSALKFTEMLAEKIETQGNTYRFWNAEALIMTLNEILREADETDDPELIQRAIALQDRFLRLNIRGIEEFFASAEKL